MLIVTQPFDGYRIGDRITDAGLIATILSTQDARNVITVGTPGTPASPATAPVSLLQLLSKAVPHLIEALPDANGTPPEGYEWIDGLGAITNYLASPGDSVFANTLPPGQQLFPYGAGVGSHSDTTSGSLQLMLNGSGAVHSFAVPVSPTDTITVLGARIVSSTADTATALVLYQVTAADGSRTAHSCFVDTTGAVSLASSLPLADKTVAAQPIVHIAGYYVMQAAGPNGASPWLLVDATTGQLLFADGATYSQLPFVGDAGTDAAFVRYPGGDAVVYQKFAVTVTDGVPAFSQIAYLPAVTVPGMTDSVPACVALPLSPTTTVFITRAGFFETTLLTAADGTLSMSVKQTAGVHPLLVLGAASAAEPATQRDPVAAQGYLDNLTLVGPFGGLFCNYTVLKSLFVRKARLKAA